MSQKQIKVLIADDHTIVREGLRAILETQTDISVVGEAGNGQEALVRAKIIHPDVILMDLVMPEMDGVEATRQISTQLPDIHILVLSSFAADDKVFPAIKAGALGYLLKETESSELIHAIRKVYQGEPSLHPSIAQMVLHELAHPISKRPPTPEPLTEREVEVLSLVAQGLSNKDIADQLFVTEATVRTHINNIFQKLHLANRVQAALYALREGLASLNDIESIEDP